jgi:hypothetical protein
MARRISKLKLILSCILAIIFVLGLCSLTQAGNNKNFGAAGKKIKQLPPGIEAKISVNNQAYNNGNLKVANCTGHGVIYEVYIVTVVPLNQSAEELLQNLNLKRQPFEKE